MSKKIIRVIEDLNNCFQVQVADPNYPDTFIEWSTHSSEAAARQTALVLHNQHSVKRIVENY